MRSRVFQAMMRCTARATHAPCAQGARPPPPTINFVPPLTSPALSAFVRGEQAPLVVRAAILSQARCLHLTQPLCKRRRKRNPKAKDDCSGRTKRRRSGFNKPCPPPPCKCPPRSARREECPHGFGGRKPQKKRFDED